MWEHVHSNQNQTKKVFTIFIVFLIFHKACPSIFLLPRLGSEVVKHGHVLVDRVCQVNEGYEQNMHVLLLLLLLGSAVSSALNLKVLS